MAKHLRELAHGHRRPLFDYSGFKVAPHATAIKELITTNPVSAVSAQTGSGKTLRIPYDLANAGLKVRVALPYTVATRSAYDFQRRHSGLDVGFAANREIRYGDSTQLVYATTGHFTTKITAIIKDAKREGRTLTVSDFTFLGDIFIVDEVHTGTVHITQLVGLLKYLKTELGEEFKVRIVFTSATLNCQDVERHFTGFPTYNVDLARLPITHIYADSERDPKTDDPIEEILDIISKELKMMERKRDTYHIIVFRPGVQEVEDLVQKLETTFHQEILALPAYSELSQEDLSAIFNETGGVKVIVGTNIIESSVTVDNVGAIINDGLVKRVFTNDTGGQKLVTGLVSQAEATQRAGRTARTRPGRAYHLYTQKYSETELCAYHPPEIERVPIHNVTLSLIDAGLEPKRILGISELRQTQALETLLATGMILADRTGMSLGTVTDAGNFVAHVNLGIYNANMIYKAIIKYQRDRDELVLISAVALAVMLEVYGPPPFYVPRRQRGQTNSDYQACRSAHIDKFFTRFFGRTELETLINVYWAMTDEVYDMSIHRSRGGEDTMLPAGLLHKDWAVDNSMNNKKLREFRNTMRPVLETVSRVIGEPELLEELEPPTDAEILDVSRQTIELFRDAYSHNVFRCIGKRRFEDRHGNRYEHSRETYSNGSIAMETEVGDCVIAAQVMEIQNRPGARPRRVIGLSFPARQETVK